MRFKAKAARRPLARGCAVFVCSLLLGAPVAAQVLPGQTPQDIDPAGRIPPVQPASIDPSSLVLAAACPFAGKGTLTLRRVDVEGATLVSRAAIDAALADLVGRTGDAALLCTARDRVAAVYARSGEALARVEIPGQQMQDGVLTLRVTEGRIVSTGLQNPEALGPSTALAKAYLARAESGAAATRWQDVERALVLVREIPGAEPQFLLRRAEDGSADGLEAIAGFAPRSIVDVTFGVHNLGSEELGREGTSLRMDGNSLTRFGERTSLVLFSSRHEEQKVAQLMGEVRLGASGWLGYGDLAYSRSQPGGGLEVLEIEGRSTVARLGARYAFERRRDAALDLGVRLEAIDQQNDLGFLRRFGIGDIPLFDERLRVLAFDAAGRWQPIGGGAFAMQYALELRQGLDALNASEAGDPLLSRAGARPDFTSLRANGTVRFAPIPEADVSPYLQGGASVQWTDDPLPAYEEFQVGNYTIGRGFDPGSASGDRAVGATFEAGIDMRGSRTVASAYAFAEGARLWNLEAFSYDAEPWSAGLGLRLRWRTGRIDLAWADPQNAAIPGGRKPSDRLFVSVTQSFSFR